MNESGIRDSFELWNMRTGNQVATFPSEDEALSAVRRLIHEHGRAYGSRLALGREDTSGTSRLLAAGNDLVRLAEQRADAAAIRR